MKLEKLNIWFTFVANLGVIASLIFIGYQTRQNTLQLRTQASYAINEGISLLNAGIYNDSVLADIVMRGEKDYFSLDSIEKMQFNAFQFDRINMALHIQILDNEGISNVHFPYIEFLVNQYTKNPGLQDFIISQEDSWMGSKELYYRLRSDK